MNKQILRFIFFLGLGILFVWLTVKDIGKEEWAHIRESVRNARHWLFIPAALMLFLSHYSRAIRWRILMEPLGYKPSRFNTFAAVMIGYLVNAGVPRLGEVMKCTLLARYEKIRADKLVGTIVVERVVDVICLTIVFLLALLLQGNIFGKFMANLFGNFIRDQSGSISYIKILVLISGFVTLLLVIYFLLRKYAHVDAVARIKNVFRGIWHGLNSLRLVRHKGWFIFHSIFIWLMYLLSTTAGLYAIRETDHLGIAAGLAVLGVGSVGIILTPGGIGAYPLLVGGLIELYKIAPETGQALGWLLWSVQTIIILIGGLLCFAYISEYNKKRMHAQSGTDQQ